MMIRTRRTALLALPVAGLLAFASPSPAQPAPLTLETLSTTLMNMGYEAKLDPNGKLLTIVAHGNYDLTINFTQGSPNGEVLAYIYLQKLTGEQQARLDMTTLLLANDAGPSYFSLARSQADFSLYIQRSMPSAAITPVALRSTIDNLVKVTQVNETVWNTRLWK